MQGTGWQAVLGYGLPFLDFGRFSICSENWAINKKKDQTKMKNKAIIATGLVSAGSLFAQEAVSTPDVSTVMSDTINNANTVLTAVIAIGGVILAWKLLRKFFSKTG